MVAVEAIGVAEQNRRPFSIAGALYHFLRNGVNGTHVLPVDLMRRHTKSGASSLDVTGSRFRVMGVLVVHVVFADVDHREFPEGGHVHDFVEQALSESTVTEEADRHLTGAQALCRKRCTRCDAGAAGDDGVCSEITRGRIGDVHRPALALAISGFLTK